MNNYGNFAMQNIIRDAGHIVPYYIKMRHTQLHLNVTQIVLRHTERSECIYVFITISNITNKYLNIFSSKEQNKDINYIV